MNFTGNKSLWLGAGLAAASAIGQPIAVQADSMDLTDFLKGSLYVAGSVAYVIPEDADLATSIPGASVLGLKADLGSTVGATGALGWMTQEGWRFEAEFSWFDVDINGIEIIGITIPAAGSVEAYSGMGNILYEFQMHDTLHPYLGGGIGVTHFVATTQTIAGIPVPSKTSDTVFSYQGIAGLAYIVNPNVAVTADYRYFGANDTDFAGVDAEISAHKVTLGLRYSFD